jgi:hypothetical protein
MRSIAQAVWVVAILTLGGAGGATVAAGDSPGSIAIVFKDGHRQNVDIANIARLEFKAPVLIVFKDGHQQNIPASEIVRIEFQTGSNAFVPDQGHFLGKWKVGDGNRSTFYITLESGGEARKSLGSSHGTWAVVDGEARISWDDGWHDTIRKVGTRHEKFAYEPGKSFSDPPSNVTAAVRTETKPI